jgi:glycosyltransferase involved in cell wall biosynthesis
MPDRRFPVLAVATHPVQYSAPFFRRMASCQQLDFHVAYGSLRGVARLVFAGDGSLRSRLEAEASALLPAGYKSPDLMFLPSEYEPFALVVNQAMCCGCPAVASDRVGAARDLLVPVCPEFVFPCGAADALAALLENAVADRSHLQPLGERGVAHRRTWSAERNITATIDAIQSAVARKSRVVRASDESPVPAAKSSITGARRP